MTFIRLAWSTSRALTYTPLIYRAGLWRFEKASKKTISQSNLDSGSSVRRWRACGRTIESEHFVRVAAEFYGTIARFLEQLPRSGSHCPARMLSPACTAATHDVSAADAECSCTILRIHSGGSRRGNDPDDFHFELIGGREQVCSQFRTARLPSPHTHLVHVLTAILDAITRPVFTY